MGWRHVATLIMLAALPGCGFFVPDVPWTVELDLAGPGFVLTPEQPIRFFEVESTTSAETFELGEEVWVGGFTAAHFVSFGKESSTPAMGLGRSINEEGEQAGYPWTSVQIGLPYPAYPGAVCDDVACSFTGTIYVRLLDPLVPTWGRIWMHGSIASDEDGDVPEGVWCALRITSLDEPQETVTANSRPGGCAAADTHWMTVVVLLGGILRARRRQDDGACRFRPCTRAPRGSSPTRGNTKMHFVTLIVLAAVPGCGFFVPDVPWTVELDLAGPGFVLTPEQPIRFFEVEATTSAETFELGEEGIVVTASAYARFVSLTNDDVVVAPGVYRGHEVNEDAEARGYPQLALSIGDPEPNAAGVTCDDVTCTRVETIYVRLVEPNASMWGRLWTRSYIEGQTDGDVPEGVWCALRITSLDEPQETVTANSRPGGCAAADMHWMTVVVLLGGILRARRRQAIAMRRIPTLRR